MKIEFNDNVVWVVFFMALAVMIIFVCDDLANATDSTMIINCRDVPDSLVKRCLDWDALWGWDEWGEPKLILEAEICQCPKGTRKKRNPLVTNASNPPSYWVECWTVKTVCDTVWTKEKQ